MKDCLTEKLPIIYENEQNLPGERQEAENRSTKMSATSISPSRVMTRIRDSFEYSSSFRICKFDMMSVIKEALTKEDFHIVFLDNNLLISSPSWFRVVLRMTRWRVPLMERRMEAERSRINRSLTRWRRDVVSFYTA